MFRYTPNPSAPGYSSSAQQRVIKMVEAQVDPMEPPKHPHRKAPRGPVEDPVPILHSPPRKLTVADQQAWKIPPAISNWKNAKGFIIPLDKRLAADGRGLQEVTINNNFATLSEALYVAERKAAEELRIRNQIRKKMSVQEKEEREKELRDMAMKARMERSGVLSNADIGDDIKNRAAKEERSYYQPSSPKDDVSDESEEERYTSKRTNDRNEGRSKYDDRRNQNDDEYDKYKPREMRTKSSRDDESDGDVSSQEEPDIDETEAQRRERIEREKLRIQKRKERERELRLENMKVSEQIIVHRFILY